MERSRSTQGGMSGGGPEIGIDQGDDNSNIREVGIEWQAQDRWPCFGRVNVLDAEYEKVN